MIRRLFSPARRLPETTVAELAAELQAGRDVQVVDVRETDEWRSGHIAGALHIPLGELGRRASELDPLRPTVVVCRSGNRSAYATAALLKAGFADARNLDSGMVGWTRAGNPVER